MEVEVVPPGALLLLPGLFFPVCPTGHLASQQCCCDSATYHSLYLFNGKLYQRRRPVGRPSLKEIKAMLFPLAPIGGVKEPRPEDADYGYEEQGFHHGSELRGLKAPWSLYAV